LGGLKNGPNVIPTYTGKAGRICRVCNSVTIEHCALSEQTCELGDLDVCFLELREVNARVKHVLSGCKSKVACDKSKEQNFVTDGPNQADSDPNDQCKPGVSMASLRFGKVGSVCRTCFSTSNNVAANALQVAAGNLVIPKWDGATQWELGTGGDNRDRSFWLEDLYATQQANN
jgi:hypothetical protein